MHKYRKTPAVNKAGPQYVLFPRGRGGHWYPMFSPSGLPPLSERLDADDKPGKTKQRASQNIAQVMHAEYIDGWNQQLLQAIPTETKDQLPSSI